MLLTKRSATLTASADSSGLAVATGCLTDETADCDNQKADYQSSKDAILDWSHDAYINSDGAHYGIVCKQHDATQVLGYLIEPPRCDDATRSIHITFRAADKEASRLLRDGFVAGLSHHIEADRLFHAECNSDVI